MRYSFNSLMWTVATHAAWSNCNADWTTRRLRQLDDTPSDAASRHARYLHSALHDTWRRLLAYQIALPWQLPLKPNHRGRLNDEHVLCCATLLVHQRRREMDAADTGIVSQRTWSKRSQLHRQAAEPAQELSGHSPDWMTYKPNVWLLRKRNADCAWTQPRRNA